MSEFFVSNPKHTSINQIKNELKLEARKKANLKPVADFSVDDKTPPSLKYIATPAAVSKKHLDEIRKRSNFSDLKRLEAKQGNTEIGIDRLLKKEDCIFRLGDVDNRKTKDILVENRKREMLENNMRVFGNVSIGIHGKELPKFHQSMAEWWKTREGFNEKPHETSLLRFKQSMKYWAKPDNILLADVEYGEPGPDDFKQTHVKQIIKDDVATSPNKLNRVKKKEYALLGGTSEKPKRNYRWTSLENKFVERSNKFTAEVDKARAERSDYEPLYSSFSPNGTFMPPPTASEILHMQREKLHKTNVSATLTNKSKGLRATTAFLAEESLMASGNASTNLFTRVGTIEGSPMKLNSKTFKNSTHKGIRAGAFKNS